MAAFARSLQGLRPKLGRVTSLIDYLPGDPAAARAVDGQAASAPAEADRWNEEERSVVRTALVRFLLISLVALVVVMLPTLYVMRSVARDHALDGAIERAEKLAAATVSPYVHEGVLAGDPASLRTLDRVVQARISDGSVYRIKVWSAQGRVLYSDEKRLIGNTYELPDWAPQLLASGGATAEFEHQDEAENQFERGPRQLVEVYATTTASTGDKLIFEAYFPAEDVTREEDQLVELLLPIVVIALVVLQLTQLPSALALARRVQRAHRSRRRLLAQAVAASDLERRRIARDLHDDVIGDLAGLGYALESVHNRLPEDVAPVVDQARTLVRRDVATLRTMLTDLYPADLDSVGLAAAIDERADALRLTGTVVHLDVPAPLDVSSTTATLLYRIARESLANIAKHAAATSVQLTISVTGDNVDLLIVDDGAGFDVHGAGATKTGHLGLRLVRDTVREAGGTVELISSPGHGTTVAAHLPRS